MIEIECPFCDQPVAVEIASLLAERFVVRCDECSVETEVTDTVTRSALGMAA